MQVKLFAGLAPAELEKSLNAWLDALQNDSTTPAKVWIHNVQQYTIGEVMRSIGLASMPGQQPNVQYTFCLLVFYSITQSTGTLNDPR
jgi:hypothetical protein